MDQYESNWIKNEQYGKNIWIPNGSKRIDMDQKRSKWIIMD